MSKTGASARSVTSFFVNSPSFDKLKLCAANAATHRKKAAAVAHFLAKTNGLRSVGFSDDDIDNVRSIRREFKKMKPLQPNVRFSVFSVLGDKIHKARC